MTGWPVLDIELLWIVLFSTRIWPIHAKYIKIPQSLVITNFNWMNASGNLRCIALPFVISLTSLSYGCVLILPFCISSLPFSPHDPILTGHQALAPSSPMLLVIKISFVRMEFSWRAWAKTWHETDDLRTTNEAHSAAKLRKSPCSSSHFWIQVSCSKTKKKKWPHDIYHFDKELFVAILARDFWWYWTCQVVLTTKTAQPNTNSWPLHPNLSCLIPLLPYSSFTSWESHSFRHFSLYSIHFTEMT